LKNSDDGGDVKRYCFKHHPVVNWLAAYDKAAGRLQQLIELRAYFPKVFYSA